MGNSLSYQNLDNKNEGNQENAINIKSINKDNLTDLVDEIASEFILKQNIIDMIRFSDKSYYDNMIVLTSSIINKELTDLELSILQDRVLNTTNHNTNKNSKNNSEDQNSHSEKNVIYFTSSDELKQLTLKSEKEKEKALMIISKFYIKIMTIFSAITAIMDPQYVYESETGEKKYFQLKDYDSYKMIDKHGENIKIHQLYNPMGLVRKR